MLIPPSHQLTQPSHLSNQLMENATHYQLLLTLHPRKHATNQLMKSLAQLPSATGNQLHAQLLSYQCQKTWYAQVVLLQPGVINGASGNAMLHQNVMSLLCQLPSNAPLVLQSGMLKTANGLAIQNQFALLLQCQLT
jgi:hypothetical protein